MKTKQRFLINLKYYGFPVILVNFRNPEALSCLKLETIFEYLKHI